MTFGLLLMMGGGRRRHGGCVCVALVGSEGYQYHESTGWVVEGEDEEGKEERQLIE